MERYGTEERRIYSLIGRSGGLRAREIAQQLGLERGAVNRFLYASPLMRELCYTDRDYRWHALIPQRTPHTGLYEFSAWYSPVGEFLQTPEERWLEAMRSGCERIGRSTSDARGLFHSFSDCRETMCTLFRDLEDLGCPDHGSWEIAFELRFKRSKHIRIYADVLVITPRHIFSLEFKMKDRAEPEEILQAAKYCAYEDLIFGERYETVPVLVLTGARETYGFERVPGTDAEIQMVSGDMLYNAFDQYLNFLNR